MQWAVRCTPIAPNPAVEEAVLKTKIPSKMYLDGFLFLEVPWWPGDHDVLGLEILGSDRSSNLKKFHGSGQANPLPFRL